MAFLTANIGMILSVLLILSEAMAAVCQMAFPNNKGVSGVVASIIKILQGLGAKEPGA